LALPSLGWRALAGLPFLAIVAGCTGATTQLPAESPVSAGVIAPQGGAVDLAWLPKEVKGPKHSWMLPEAKSKDLLYLSDFDTNDVYIFSYPQGKLEGTLTGFKSPLGECVDKNNDVFITDELESEIFEYAHGGTHPIATLRELRYDPRDCSIDPTTGNLAVVNNAVYSDASIGVFLQARGKALQYATDLKPAFFGSYDGQGDVIVGGWVNGSALGFVELKKGAKSVRAFTLNESLSYPGGIKWDGKHLAVGDADTSIVYEFSIKGSAGTEVGATTLSGGGYPEDFCIYGSQLIAPTWFGSISGAILLYNYPAGGSPTKTIQNSALEYPFGAALSLHSAL
jgi:hypothetical protein